jgi:hypothetical protein
VEAGLSPAHPLVYTRESQHLRDSLQQDLAEYLDYFNYDRAHTGRLTKGRVCPQIIVHGARQTSTVR